MNWEMRRAVGTKKEGFRRATIWPAAIIALGLNVLSLQGGESTDKPVITETVSIWTNSVGGGFRRGVKELNISGGYGYGLEIFGTTHQHNWWLTTAQFGWILSDVVGRGHWYEGNWEA
ncbi:MAG TPA: hypothetical protein VLT36_24660, partial [Candidatus Dormibacteraeota bacterium]|nr:hypothetical protein [Candidatus Dormibacteraeota bacterium]